ncbi:2-amino-4-hydroxy-6-hydroxymethyldihydropteridine diphosphokinase [Dyella japonica]|uniref:2-amino-4-hydroxy-6-hydroxymethyldihydropteridine pyrophosphokinase n=1 Tax=Dyella japonica DSM 16301 TaxID=1440762 RepID=A0A0G9H7G7_9GAMM|nr:2-amino-4-hydroxy-6-hydroxymethyldihydropteridine diphosphokinase [Dyella japonica]KLD63617.1 2-amino-4-hydroxy-6-hydroxymethyldihydropteridine pyrophosphokinase [Dyella japonica DSM 16301]
MTLAYIALGSNLGDAQAQVLGAFAALDALPQTRLLARSPLYLTPPWGVLEQPPFINAVAQIDTALTPHELLDALLKVERAAGRVRDGERWGPRTLDLDVLHMDGVALSDDRLTLPHPRMAERAFVLLPLNDLAPALALPGQGKVADLLAAMDTTGCERLP